MFTFQAPLCIACLLLAPLQMASADVVVDTGSPNPLNFGFDIASDQSVAVAFVPEQSVRFTDVSLWLMSNASGPGAEFTLSLRENLVSANGSVPSDGILESWQASTSAVGLNPVLETWQSADNIILNAGETYWIVAESDRQSMNPVWVVGTPQVETLMATNTIFSNGWSSNSSFGVPGVRVDGIPVPVPSTTLALGLMGLSAVRRRR